MIKNKDCCKNCEHALKRSNFSFKKNGFRFLTHECLMQIDDDTQTFVEPQGWCPLFKKRGKAK